MGELWTIWLSPIEEIAGEKGRGAARLPGRLSVASPSVIPGGLLSSRARFRFADCVDVNPFCMDVNR